MTTWYTTDDMGLSHVLRYLTQANCGVDLPFVSRYRVTDEKPKCSICREG